jgi:cold shock CspA family protein
MNMMVSAAAMASATTALTSAPIEKPSADAALLEMEERIFQHREAAEAIEPELDRLRDGKVSYDVVANRGKESAENLRIG